MKNVKTMFASLLLMSLLAVAAIANTSATDGTVRRDDGSNLQAAATRTPDRQSELNDASTADPNDKNVNEEDTDNAAIPQGSIAGRVNTEQRDGDGQGDILAQQHQPEQQQQGQVVDSAIEHNAQEERMVGTDTLGDKDAVMTQRHFADANIDGPEVQTNNRETAEDNPVQAEDRKTDPSFTTPIGTTAVDAQFLDRSANQTRQLSDEDNQGGPLNNPVEEANVETDNGEAETARPDTSREWQRTTDSQPTSSNDTNEVGQQIDSLTVDLIGNQLENEAVENQPADGFAERLTGETDQDTAEETGPEVKRDGQRVIDADAEKTTVTTTKDTFTLNETIPEPTTSQTQEQIGDLAADNLIGYDTATVGMSGVDTLEGGDTTRGETLPSPEGADTEEPTVTVTSIDN